MKKIALLSLLLINSAQAAIQLSSYSEVVNALHNGMDIKYVVDWDQCTISLPEVKPGFSSSWRPAHVNISKKGALQSQGVTYTHQISQAPQIGPVNQSYVYTLTSNNVLRVVNRFLDPVTNVEKFPAVEAICQLNEGVRIFATE